MEVRLLRPQDNLEIGDCLMLRNRFNKNKYAIFKINDVVKENGKAVYFALQCLQSYENYYRKGSVIGCDFSAHSEGHSKSIELTYIIPAGRILYGN